MTSWDMKVQDTNPPTHYEWEQAAERAIELRDSLEEMLNAALEEELPSDEVRQRAMRVFLAAKGLRS